MRADLAEVEAAVETATTGGRNRRICRSWIEDKSVNKERSTTITARVFVGNLSYETTKEELSELLSGAGEVKDIFLPTDRATGRPRGFAFVEFSSSDEAKEAIKQFDEHDLGGRKLRVNPANDRPRRQPGPPSFNSGPSFASQGRSGGGGGGGGGGGATARPAKPKGSRRGMRGKKRSL